MKNSRRLEIKGLRAWAERMKQFGLAKSRERMAWLKTSTVKKRIEILEELLTLQGDTPRWKEMPPRHFISLSLALAEKKGRHKIDD